MPNTPFAKIEVGSKVDSPGPDTDPWFWHPSQQGVRFAPDDFRDKLHEADKNLEVTWDRHNERWLMWMRAPSVQRTRGWRLLFRIQGPDGSYQPLDERIFAKLYSISGDKWGDGKKYFDALMRERERDKELADKAQDDHTWYEGGQRWNHTRPQVGAGAISASKMVGQ